MIHKVEHNNRMTWLNFSN